jgi:hypothetical protein
MEGLDNTGGKFDKYPLQPEVGEILSEAGSENLVRELGSDYVLKEVHEWNAAHPDEEVGNKPLRGSFEHLKNLAQDYKKASSYLGEYLLPAYFIRGHATNTEEPTNYVVQKKVSGPTLEEIQLNTGRYQEFLADPHTRKQLSELVWGAKKALVEMKAPLDMGLINIMYDEQASKLYQIDPGSTTELRELLDLRKVIDKYPQEEQELISQYSENALAHAQDKINTLMSLEEDLSLNVEEKRTLDSKYEIEDMVFRQTVDSYFENTKH